MALQPDAPNAPNVWPKELLLNDAYAFGFSCTKCKQIPMSSKSTADGEIICNDCSKDMNNVTSAATKVVQTMINKLETKCLTLRNNNNDQNSSQSKVSSNEGHIVATLSNEQKESCEWIGKIGEWENHSKECQYLIISCDDCKSSKCERRKLSDHHQVCPEVTINCPLSCGTSILRKNKTEHVEIVCPQYVLTCTNEDCKEQIKREDFKVHVEKECPHRVVCCDFVKFGCKITEIKAIEMKDHMDNSKFEHLSLQFESITNQQNQKIQQLEKELVMQSTENKTLLQKLETMKDEHKQQIDQVKQSVDAKVNECIKFVEAVDATQKVSPMFDRYDSRYVTIENGGKLVKKLTRKIEKNEACAYASTGYNSGMVKWQINVVKGKFGCFPGIVQSTYSGNACEGKMVRISSGNVQDGDIITVILNFYARKVRILRNGDIAKQGDLNHGKTYYPAIEFYYHGEAIFQVV